MIEAKDDGAGHAALIPKRVLIAEDSPVTQDLLKLILAQRGHVVDIAQDGEQALGALKRHHYDVALIDFHLPKLDGLQVARSYREDMNGDAKARLIAITADVEGLLSHGENCENFDQIISKPLDVFEVCTVIEHAGEPGKAGAGDANPDAAATDARPARTSGMGRPAARRPDPAWAPGLELLRWPEDFDGERFAPRTAQIFTDLAAIDAILVCAPARPADLAQIWQRKPLHLFPVIDLAGGLGPYADFDASAPSHGDGEGVRGLIQGFHQRRAQLHHDLTSSSDFGEKLLARIFVKDAELTASYDPNVPSSISYNVALADADVVRESEKFVKGGFLKRDFFDRFHTCYRCSSARLHVREECPDCRSSELSEELYVHHYKCAYQGVELDFRRGDKLICPKCRQELTHFSVDYDKPGSVIICKRCGHAGSDPAIGFVCMECKTHIDGDAAAIKDVYSYSLTREGIAFLQMGYAAQGPAQRTIRFSELPLEFVVALNTSAKNYNDAGTPFTVVTLSYDHEREIVREAGMRQYQQARDLFLETLRSRLGERGFIAKGHSYDFCLLNGLRPDSADDSISDFHDLVGSNLRVDLGLKTRLFGPEDFA